MKISTTLSFIETMAAQSFNIDGYLQESIAQIQDRISKTTGKLYLELQGDLFEEELASEFFPEYHPETKKKILKHFADDAEILIAVNAELIMEKPLIGKDQTPFLEYLEFQLKKIENQFKIRPQLVIYQVQMEYLYDIIFSFEKIFLKKGYKVREKYKIKSYPFNTALVLSEEGFGNDDHIPIFKKLAIIHEIGGNQGSFEIAMSQIYRDHEIEIPSSFASFQTLPVLGLPPQHPINQAWYQKTHSKFSGEAADIMILESDAEKFQILKSLFANYLDPEHPMMQYTSTQEMLINTTGSAINDLSQAEKRAKDWLKHHKE